MNFNMRYLLCCLALFFINSNLFAITGSLELWNDNNPSNYGAIKSSGSSNECVGTTIGYCYQSGNNVVIRADNRILNEVAVATNSTLNSDGSISPNRNPGDSYQFFFYSQQAIDGVRLYPDFSSFNTSSFNFTNFYSNRYLISSNIPGGVSVSFDSNSMSAINSTYYGYPLCLSGKVLYNGTCITNSCPAGTTPNLTTGACSGTPTNPQSYCSDGSLPKVDGTCTAGGSATNCGSGLTWNGTSCVAPVVPTTVTCPDGSTAPDLASCPVVPTPTPTPTPTPSNGGGLLPNKSRATDATTWSGLLNIDQANRFGMKFGSGAGKAYHPGAGISGGGIMFTQNPNSTTSCHNGGVNYSGINMKDIQLNTDNTRSNQDGCNLSVVMRKV
jgi:hypothetical protein